MLSIKIIFLVREMEFFLYFSPSLLISLFRFYRLYPAFFRSLISFSRSCGHCCSTKSNREIVLDSISLLNSSDLLEFATKTTNARIKHMNDSHSHDEQMMHKKYNHSLSITFFIHSLSLSVCDENTSNDLIDLMRH